MAFLLLTFFKIIWRTPCQLLAYPQGYAYPRLRTADVEKSTGCNLVHQSSVAALNFKLHQDKD